MEEMLGGKQFFELIFNKEKLGFSLISVTDGSVTSTASLE